MDGKHILLLDNNFNYYFKLYLPCNLKNMKNLLFIILFLTVNTWVFGQTRGVKIGYIDMEYILQNVPDYTEAKNQLELKAHKWKQEIDVKKNEINTLKESLKNEKVLLTKELIEEREEEITFLETELIEFQQKRFGPLGDLVTQKAVLVKPVQDQVFSAIQDLAEAQKYDFILDKSSDLTLLFAAKRHDLSDRVIRTLTRASKREQMSSKQLKALEEKERKEDFIDDNPALSERQKILDEKKAARDSIAELRKAAAEQKRKDFEDKRQKLIEEREAKKSGTVSEKPTDKDSNESKIDGVDTEEKTEANDAAKQKSQDDKLKAQEARQKLIDDRKKEIEDRKKKILEDREAAKKAREEKAKENNENKD